MRKPVFVTLLGLSLLAASCQRQAIGGDIQSGKMVGDPPVVFEIRDFKQDHRENAFRGRATVVTRDPRAQTGEAVVVLREIETRTCKTVFDDFSGGDNYKSIYLHNGVGVLETFGVDCNNKEAEFPKYEWQVVGWSSLRQARIAVEK